MPASDVRWVALRRFGAHGLNLAPIAMSPFRFRGAGQLTGAVAAFHLVR
jgi:hypothetical protein